MARLPVVPSKQGEAALGRDTSGTPRGLCDTCCARRKPAACRKIALPAALSPLPTAPSAAGGCAAASAPAQPALPSPLPANDARTSVIVVPSETTVGEVACEDSAASTPAARLSGEREMAAQHALQHEHGLAIDFRPAEPAAASERPAADRRFSQASSPGRDNRASMPTQATEPPAITSCRQFLDGLLAENYDGVQDKPVLEAIPNAILLRGERPEIQLKHKIGRVRVYARQLSPRTNLVKISQANKRRAAARGLQAGSSGHRKTARRGRTRPSGTPLCLFMAEQVGPVAARSMRHTGFNRWRLALGVRRSGLASLPALRDARRELFSLSEKQVVVTPSGAHLASLAAAIQERVSDLCDRDLFVERPVRDFLLVPAEQAAHPPVVAFPGSLPSSEPDVQVTVGLDKGGDPGTVKIVATVINQEHQNSPANTILVGVCPCQHDKYDELAAMLETHLPQIDSLLRDGVWVRGVRGLVRLILGCDNAAQCNVVGHKGASATQPCLYCLSTRSSSEKQNVLDVAYGTLQDLVVGRALREATHFTNRMAAGGAMLMVGQPCTPRHPSPVERRPLLAVHPRQIVPIPLHTTQGVNHRYFRLAIDMVMVQRSAIDGPLTWRQAGTDFAEELVQLLHEKVRVRPTSFHGGLFIGRDCHTIGDHSDVICAALKGKMSQDHLDAYECAWSIWNRVRRTLNRAVIIPAVESAGFRADTAAMVTLL